MVRGKYAAGFLDWFARRFAGEGLAPAVLCHGDLDGFLVEHDDLDAHFSAQNVVAKTVFRSE